MDSLGCLLFHMFRPDQGKILVYEREAQEVGLWQWRQWFSYVQQLSPLLNTTIKNNIILGDCERAADEAERSI